MSTLDKIEFAILLGALVLGSVIAVSPFIWRF